LATVSAESRASTVTALTVDVPSPYLLFLGDITEAPYAKTAFGLRDWAPEKCVGEYALPEATVTTGLPKMQPAAARARGARSLVIGVANRGGILNPEWLPALIEALEAGLDIVSGMHARLADNGELDAAARRLGRRLIDVRRPPAGIPIASGRKRTGQRLLTVGTDCALGKKYTALVLAREFRRGGFDADFRATGQTGILIAGSGIPLDAVVSDFAAGAAELLSPDADVDHWDVVEGQGSLFHPSYAGVSLALLHGTQPDVIVLCHEEGRDCILGLEDFPLPSLDEAIYLNLELARRTNPRVRCAGVSLNTAGLEASRARALLAERKAQLGMPVADPMRGGPELEELVASCLLPNHSHA
jgi:D-glutamate N-acetyltransferase